MRWLGCLLLLSAACNAGPLSGGGTGPDSTRYDRTTGLPATEETDEALAPDASPGGLGGEAPSSCFAEETEPAFFACDAAMEARCPRLRSCCVGDSGCCSTVTDGALPSGTIPLSECADGDALACLTEKGWPAQAFGAPRPAVRDGALMPMGDDSYDSGLVIGGALDLTAHAVVLRATFAAPSSCDEDCLDAVGIGLTAAASYHDYSHAEVLVGLLYSGARGEVSLLRGDTVVASWAMTEPTASYALRVGADRVEVERDGSSLVVTDPVSSSEGSLVVWGRNHNRPADAPLGARITALTIGTELCDIPTAWPERGSLLVRDGLGAPFLPGTLSAPTAATGPSGETIVAFENDGNILVGELSEAGEIVLTGPTHESVIDPPDGATLADPELAYDPGLGGFVLFYTIDRGETSSIGRAFGGENGTEYTTPGPIIAPKEELVRLEEPTVAQHYSGSWVVVVRGTDTGGVQRLAAFRSDGEEWTRVEGGHLEALTRRGDIPGDGDFDTDEIAHPSLIVHNGAWQLYYAGRRGTRWGIGLIVSDELLHWRDVGQVLAGDGNGFDRLGVTGPDASHAAGEVTLLYEGFDGVRTSLGHATRPATDTGTP